MRKVAEKLPPDELYSQLQNKACVLEKILAQKKKALENAPEGSLRVSICNKNKQFYWVKKDEGKNGAKKFSNFRRAFGAFKIGSDNCRNARKKWNPFSL